MIWMVFLTTLNLRWLHTDYKHDEHHEPGEIENTFENRGLDGTLELGHHAIAGMSGVVGLHFENSTFKQPNGVLLPNANTDSQSVYVYEELPINEHKLTLGFRRGNHDVKRNAFTGDGGCSQYLHMPILWRCWWFRRCQKMINLLGKQKKHFRPIMLPSGVFIRLTKIGL